MRDRFREERRKLPSWVLPAAGGILLATLALVFYAKFRSLGKVDQSDFNNIESQPQNTLTLSAPGPEQGLIPYETEEDGHIWKVDPDTGARYMVYSNTDGIECIIIIQPGDNPNKNTRWGGAQTLYNPNLIEKGTLSFYHRDSNGVLQPFLENVSTEDFVLKLQELGIPLQYWETVCGFLAK